jgi:UDP-glucose 4-epimerase
MKVLVTGGSGFIGSHVVDKLKNKGIEVRIYDGVMPTFREDLEFYQGSILNIDSLSFAMNGIDAVFHLAAIADVKDVYNEPYYSESINVRGTINVLEAARKAGVKKVIYGSTTWVYSDARENIVDESTPLYAPSHFYTATKLASEYYCQSYSKLYGLEVTILRYGIPYGPRARDGAVVPIFVRKALNGEPLTIAGDGSQFRKFVYVEDLAEGNVLALKDIANNKVYNLDGEEKVTIRQIAETIKKILGDVKIEYTPARPGDFSGKEVSSKLANEELDWKPKTSFEEGVRRYIKWYKEREGNRKRDWEKIDEGLKNRSRYAA